MLDAGLRPLLERSLRYGVKPAMSPGVPFFAQRAWTKAMVLATARMPRPTIVQRVRLGGVIAERVNGPIVRPGIALLYFHGGGFCIGSPRMHRSIAARLAGATGIATFVPDYRLAPEAPYPAAFDDALAAYRALVVGGYAPHRIVVAGDSAGGGLALALLIALRDCGDTLPAGLLVFSPWVDLTLEGASIAFNAKDDPVVSHRWLERCARLYRGAIDARDPRVSPLFASLTGLPPIAIHVGTKEMLLDDSARLAVAARGAGLRVDLRRYDGLWHNSQFQAGLLPSANASFADAAEFVESALDEANVQSEIGAAYPVSSTKP